MGRFLLPQRSQIIRWRGALEELLPPDHLARFVWQIVSSLVFSGLEAHYRSVQGGAGRSPYHPRLVAALWIYGTTQGLETAAAIAQACRLRDDFRWLAGGLCPSDQTLLNLLTVALAGGLGSIWKQVLAAMHRAGHIDLSALVEDGCKLRANASPRSFHTAVDITDIVTDLERQLAAAVQALRESRAPHAIRATVRALEGRIARAKQAAVELQQRRDRGRPDPAAPSDGEAGAPADPGAGSARAAPPLKFARADFRHDAARDMLVCPAGEPLTFRGVYREPGESPYRLYRAHMTSCRGCGLKAKCTTASRRSVKIPVEPSTHPAGPAPAPSGPSPQGQAPPVPPAAQTGQPPSGPRASITEPEAVMMLATSEKRWQPSYNADFTVTRHGIIVNQFLTKDTTDYVHFRRALPAVLTTLGRPDAWVGDGHYATQENIVLAHRAGVVLYAPLPDARDDAPGRSTGASADPGAEASAEEDARPRKFCAGDFRHDSARDVLVCPAGEELRLIGIYGEEYHAAYRVYGRSNCGPCSLKPLCTERRGRRVKLPATTAARPPSLGERTSDPPPSDPAAALPMEPGGMTPLIHALEARMRDMGDRIKKFRGATIEPVNAQLKQHGLGRFHVRGAARCAIVQTLVCLAHNLMKWRAREAAHALKVLA